MSKAVGEIIRNARLSAGHTQEQLIERLGIAWQSLSYLENGKFWPSARVLAAIQEELGDQVVDDILAQIRKELRG